MSEDEESNEALLARMPALETASADVLAWLADHVDLVRFHFGDHLVTEGDTDRDCYLIVDGDVEIRKTGARREEDHEGDITGELALLYGRPRTATATAVGPVTALRLRAADFDELARTSPGLAANAAEAIIDYLRFRFGFEPPGPWTPPT